MFMAILTFTGEILSIDKLNYDTIRFSLSVPKDFTYEPGQFITFMLEKDGVKKPRSYSILSSVIDGRVEFVVKLVDGGVAGEIFKKMQVGDKFEVKGPLGQLVFNANSKDNEHWFMACGCGVVPMYSILEEYLETNPNKKFVLLFSVKTKEDLILDQEFKDLEEKYPNFEYVPTLTREEWSGKTGRVQKHLPEDLKNKTFYICGLKGLVVNTKELLLDKGVKAEDVKTERYN